MATDDATEQTNEAEEPQLELVGSRQFTSWMLEHSISLAFTTYQTGKLFLIGVKPDGRLSVFERTFNRCMGLWADGQTLWLSSLYQMWRFENVLAAGQIANGYDRLYVPQMGYTTGGIDIHDVTVDSDGRVVFVNTLFGCLGTLSETHSFSPLWRPPFISKLAAEDRCHLNGLAMRDGKPRYATAVSQSDVNDGWRDRRRDGGVVVDVTTDEVIASGLSMPHSPRVYRDKLWLLDSGNGYFGHTSLDGGDFENMTFCPGYQRGLAFCGDFAVVGLSKPRKNKTFTGLNLDDELASRDAEPRCGLQVIDLNTGDIVHWLRIEGIVTELYDVVVLPQVQRPMALGFKTDEIRRTISLAPEGEI
ncbi:MAG: TIGR03032 family protein [Planctomycetaceae bacterium]|nr:TIGR03032 family protein [Planctomycetaceae bacterium]